jgi:glycolate oxidase iron-sulfur subunit
MIRNVELKNMMNRCSRCGACQAYCPLYQETGLEPFVARGKVELLDLLQDSKLQWNDKLAEIFSTCLLCGNCGDNCPNKVKADLLVREGRRDLVVARGLPIIKRTVFNHLLKKDGRLGMMAKLLYLYQHSGLQQVIRKSRVLEKLPGNLDLKEKILPNLSSREFRKMVPKVIKTENSKLRVGYFTGCMTNYVYPQTGFSVLKVLKANKVEVVIPEQGCCGIPALASGDYETVRELARKNLASFNSLSLDYIVTDCASCLGTWLEYPELWQDNGVNLLVEKIMDISTFLVKILQIELPNPVDLGLITYHDPCHLKRVPGGRENPRALLKQITGNTRFVEMKDADRCCGSAGSFHITHYQLSQKVVQAKVKTLESLQAQYLATGCPACMMQLSHAFSEAGLPTKVVHTMELVAKAY